MPGRAATLIVLSTLVAAGVALAACASIPDLTFVEAAVSDAGDASVATDGGVPDDASSDGAALACPAAPPTGADLCCGNIACAGTCSSTNCARCQTDCAPTQLCCAKPNNVVCRPLDGVCP